MGRNAFKSMHAYLKFPGISAEEQKRVYEKFTKESKGSLHVNKVRRRADLILKRMVINAQRFV